jgi:hypothetical protein
MQAYSPNILRKIIVTDYFLYYKCSFTHRNMKNCSEHSRIRNLTPFSYHSVADEFLQCLYLFLLLCHEYSYTLHTQDHTTKL